MATISDPDMFQNNVKTMVTEARKAQRSSKNWIEFHNKIYGVGGQLMRLFPTQAERVVWSQTPEAEEVTRMIDVFKGKNSDFSEVRASANGKILVRVPKSVHAKLLLEAEAEGVSLNQLCASKLAVDLAAAIH